MALITTDVDLCNIALSLVGHDKIASLSASNKAARQCNLNYSNSLESLLEKFDWNFARKRDRLNAVGVRTAGVVVTAADADPDTLTRDTGSYITDGFEDGDNITIVGSSNNNSTFDVDIVTSALVLTLDAHEALTAEAMTISSTLKMFANPAGSVYSYKYIKPTDAVIIRSVNEVKSTDTQPNWDEEKVYIVTNEKDTNDQINISYTQRIIDVSKFPSVFQTVLEYIIAIKIVMPLANSRTLRADLIAELDDVYESSAFVSAWKGNPDTEQPDNSFPYLAAR